MGTKIGISRLLAHLRACHSHDGAFMDRRILPAQAACTPGLLDARQQTRQINSKATETATAADLAAVLVAAANLAVAALDKEERKNT